MRRIAKIILLTVGSLFAVLLLAACGIYTASQQQPSFYAESLTLNPEQQTEHSDALLSEATALSSQAQKPGGWQAKFTEDEINGWLAVDWVKNHRETIPPEVRDPRIHFDQQQATLAWRYDTSNFSSVVSLNVEVTLPKPSQIAIRFRSAQAGVLPLPLKRFLDGISSAAQEAELSLQWVQSGGDPVALLEFPRSEEDVQFVLDKLEIRSGEVFFAGRTIRE